MSHSLEGIQLTLYTDEEVRNLSAVQVLFPSTLERSLPKSNGLSDSRFGVTDRNLRCTTCGQADCFQHFGHIELNKPVCRLGQISLILYILRSVCWACSRRKFTVKGEPGGFLDARSIISSTSPNGKERLRAISEACKNRFKCPWNDESLPISERCGVPQPSYVLVNKMFFKRTFREKEECLFESEEERVFANSRLMPDEIQSILRHIPLESLILMGFRPEISHPMNYIMSAHIVPPPIIRPASGSVASDSRSRGENDMTTAFQDIIRSNNELKSIHDDPKSTEKERYQAWDKLQLFCGALINQVLKKQETYDGTPLMHSRAIANRQVKDLKSRLTGKRGRLRGNLSGKRVDHAARSVVGPDSFHDIYELGVPKSIMSTLTFPEHVNRINLNYLASCVAKGSNVLGGALTVRTPALLGQKGTEGGEKVHYISLLDELGRKDLAASLKPGMIVERHLRNGDWCLFNRQPSLHKGSIQAFQIYNVPSLQFKLPLPCTKPFNADFDGDEMNLHSLQGYEAIAEAQEIMSVPFQMVTPQSNSVSIGLVQDSLVGAYKISSKDSFLKRDRVMQLIMCFRHNPLSSEYNQMPIGKPESFVDFLMQRHGHRQTRIEHCNSLHFSNFFDTFLPCPAILKGTTFTKNENGVFIKQVHGPLWTGKQVFSWLLHPAISLQKPISGGDLNNLNDWMNDKIVYVRNGEVFCGRLCKQTLGSTTGGIIHVIWKHCGAWAAAHFVSDAQRLMMQWLIYYTVSISILDCINDAEKAVDDLVAESMGKADALMLSDVPESVREQRQTQVLQDILRSAGGKVLENMDPLCGIATVVNSGAKGNLMNLAQISGIVGQQTLNGARVQFRKGPLGPRTLSCFSPGDGRPEARGFVASSYLMGLQPSEFFFHQQAGREGVVATVSGTSETGYNHRKMIKGQESEVIMYDGSVRVSTNVIIQLHYGGDDYDGVHVERVKMPVLSILDEKSVLQHLGFIQSTQSTQSKKFTHSTHSVEEKDELKRVLDSWKFLRNIKLSASKYGNDFLSEICMPANFERVVSFTKSKCLQNTQSFSFNSAYSNSDESNTYDSNGSNTTLVLLSEIMLKFIYENILRAHLNHSTSSFSALNLTKSPTLYELLYLPKRDWRKVDDPSSMARHALALMCTSSSLKKYGIFEKELALEIASEFIKLYTHGIVNPGEGVGAVGSSSIGEPSTQLTLNIFHYSGIAEKNVTLTGLPRFKQIINAIDTSETSNMRLTCIPPKVNSTIADDSAKLSAKKFAASLPRVMLAEVVEFSRVMYSPLGYSSLLSLNNEVRDTYVFGKLGDISTFLDIESLSYFTLSSISGSQSVNSFSSGISGASKLNSSPAIKKLKNSTKSRIASVIESQTPPSLNGSGSGNKTNQSSKNASSYVCVFKLDKTALTQRSLSVDDIVNALRLFVGEEAHVISSKRWCKDWLVSIRPPAFGTKGDMDRCITEAVHDSLLESAIVNGLHGVTKAIASYDSQIKKWVVDTDGSDVVSANRLSGIDKQFTWTNNIIETGKCFGVEAAVALQQVELHRVLSFDGSYVDPRHTWLLSDAVTRSGTTNPLNRHKMEELGGSLLQCASFEQTLDVFGVGAAFGSSDNLSGATEKLIVGQPVHVGTGSFEILLDSNSIIKENPSTFVGPLFNKSISKTFSNSEYVTPLLLESNDTDMECEVLPINFKTSSFSMAMDTEMDKSQIIEVEPLFSINEMEEDLVIVEPLNSETKQDVLQSSNASTEKSKEYIPPRLITTNDLPLSNLNLHGNTFSSQCFSSLEIFEFAKELSPVLEIMQKSATNRRSIFLKAVIGSTSLSLSRQTVLNFEMNLEKYYNWSHTESWTQTTRVYYNNSFTDVIYKNKSILRESFKMETLFSGTIRLGNSENFKSKRILIDQSLFIKADVDEDCILPSRVDIFQHKLYTKGPFEISLTKMWSAKNIVEAEKLQHDENPKLSVSVKLKSPDFILERNQSNFTVALSLGLFVASCVENLYF
jgi:DNA-directed RNA polymerase II subunit RPB1